MVIRLSSLWLAIAKTAPLAIYVLRLTLPLSKIFHALSEATVFQELWSLPAAPQAVTETLLVAGLNRIAMIAQLDTIALRKLFSQLNAQEPPIAQKNQSTSKHVKEVITVTMKIINSRHCAQWIIIVPEVLRTLFSARLDIFVKKEVNFHCFVKLVILLNRHNTEWWTHVRCVHRALTQLYKMKSVILALLVIYVMAKQVRSIQHSSGSTRVKYVPKAITVHWAHT